MPRPEAGARPGAMQQPEAGPRAGAMEQPEAGARSGAMQRPEAEARLGAMLRASPRVMAVLETVRAAGLPDWRLVSGAVYGTAFNHLTGRDPDYGIKDYDIAYFDPDTSWAAEDAVIRRVAEALPADLRPLVEVRNQARVHLWFGAKFGGDFPPLTCTDAALDRYLCRVHAVAVRLEPDGRFSFAAPFGYEDLFALRLAPNPATINPGNRPAKNREVRARWPEVVEVGA